jgi:hypothetical protein
MKILEKYKDRLFLTEEEFKEYVESSKSEVMVEKRKTLDSYCFKEY